MIDRFTFRGSSRGEDHDLVIEALVSLKMLSHQGWDRLFAQVLEIELGDDEVAPWSGSPRPAAPWAGRRMGITSAGDSAMIRCPWANTASPGLPTSLTVGARESLLAFDMGFRNNDISLLDG
jgi:hypothetical protein